MGTRLASESPQFQPGSRAGLALTLRTRRTNLHGPKKEVAALSPALCMGFWSLSVQEASKIPGEKRPFYFTDTEEVISKWEMFVLPHDAKEFAEDSLTSITRATALCWQLLGQAPATGGQ